MSGHRNTLINNVDLGSGECVSFFEEGECFSIFLVGEECLCFAS
jgi:hypothetical protein